VKFCTHLEHANYYLEQDMLTLSVKEVKGTGLPMIYPRDAMKWTWLTLQIFKLWFSGE